MTAKQKANRERFKKVVKEAANLRKKNKKLTQAQAVKQAWAIMYSKTGTVKKKKGKKVAGTQTHKDTKSHNVNIRVVSGVGKTTSKKEEGYIRKELGKKGYKLVHGYKVAKRKSIGELPGYRDPDAAREIELYADNDSQLYYQSRRPILINLARKYKKGTFDIDKAAKLWRYYIDAALKKYNKEFGSRGDKWFELLDTHDRQLLALEYATRTKEEFQLGNLPE